MYLIRTYKDYPYFHIYINLFYEKSFFHSTLTTGILSAYNGATRKSEATSMAVTSETNQNPQPIIDLILADINAVIPNLSSLVASYRLLVGASEEIHRTPELCPDVFERAVRRADNTGTLIDIFLELLYCKIAFSSEFLKISCAPVDLFRLLNNSNTATDIPFRTAEQVVEMEVLRRILEKCQHQNSCMPQHTVVCPSPTPTPPVATTPATTPSPISGDQLADILEVEAAILSNLQAQLGSKREVPIESKLRRKHLKDAYDTPQPKKR